MPSIGRRSRDFWWLVGLDSISILVGRAETARNLDDQKRPQGQNAGRMQGSRVR
jgi:hypothetical protein